MSSAEVKKIDDGIDLLVVNLPAFVGLKLIAWKDRKAKKDLQDINFILQKYEDDERIFEELSDELANGQIEFEEAPAFILGLDIRNIFCDDTLKQLDEILSQILKNRNTIFPQLVPQTLNTEEWDAILEKTIRLFQALQRGIKP